MTTLHGAPLPKDFKDNTVLTADDFNAVKDYWVVDELPDTAENGDVVFVIGDSPVGGNELPGLGGWATIEEVSGNPNRYTYNDGSMDWVAYEWTDDGSVKTDDGGLVDVLVVSAASNTTSRTDQGGHGGGVFRGVEVLENSDPYLITVGKGAQYNSSGGPSIFNGMGPTGGLWNDYNWAGATGGVISMGLGGLSSYPGHGQMDDILGPDEIRGYGGGAYADPVYGGGNPPRANSGAGRTPGGNAPGADGVVIIRVPVANDNTQGQGSTPASVVAAVDQAKETAKQTIKRNRSKR